MKHLYPEDEAAKDIRAAEAITEKEGNASGSTGSTCSSGDELEEIPIHASAASTETAA